MRGFTEPADPATRHQFQALLERADGVQAAPRSQMAAAAQPAATGTPLPAIKAPWPGVDGVFMGVSSAKDGTVHAVVRLNVKPPAKLNWADSVEWAKQQGGELINRVDGALCFANASELFEPGWYWTAEQYSDSGAWGQYFDLGSQLINYKSCEGWAVAVRRFPLQSFVPLVTA